MKVHVKELLLVSSFSQMRILSDEEKIYGKEKAVRKYLVRQVTALANAHESVEIIVDSFYKSHLQIIKTLENHFSNVTIINKIKEEVNG